MESRKKLRRLNEFAVAMVGILILTGCTDTNLTGADSDVMAEQSVAPANESAVHTYLVNIKNLTTGQVFSPGVAVTHTGKFDLFKKDDFASEGIRLIAENGDPTTALAELDGNPDVHTIFNIDAPIMPGSNRDFEIAAAANAQYLSLAVMVVCTNDGFTGLSGLKLPGGFKEEMHYAMAYDAGTEANLETSETIVDVGLCSAEMDGNARQATHEPIALHEGIQGGADLDPNVHGWSGPVARITIERIH